MVIAVTGGRDYKDRKFVYHVLDKYLTVATVIVHGGCSGVDKYAGDWAREHMIEERIYKADWKKYGRAGGPIRNREMLIKEKPRLLIAWPGNDGTAGCINIAKELKIHVMKAIEL